jgi:hypothetical protein
MYISGIEEQIIEQIREDREYSLGKETAYYCENCKSMQLSDTKIINGRVGHIDNWVPDEYVSYCQSCGRNLED